MRLFAGIALPGTVLSSLSALLARLKPVGSLRWSPVENLHITTKFIGEWPEDRLEELKTALQMVRAEPFDIEVRGLGWFPNPHQPRVFWAAVHAGDALPALAQATDDATAGLGVARENKPYSPHLTLARIPTPSGSVRLDLAPLRQAIAALDSAEFGQFRADRFFLYLSRPSPGGSVYTKLGEFPVRRDSRPR